MLTRKLLTFLSRLYEMRSGCEKVLAVVQRLTGRRFRTFLPAHGNRLEQGNPNRPQSS